MLKLPKDVVSDPRHEAVAKLLEGGAKPLWENGRVDAPHLVSTPALGAILRESLAAGQAVQGLELIADKLAAEQRGLDALKEKVPESPQNARASRILFIANDGSTRFYRDADALLMRYERRLLACRLDLAGEALGEAIFGQPRIVRAVLVIDKKLAARTLFALLPAG